MIYLTKLDLATNYYLNNNVRLISQNRIFVKIAKKILTKYIDLILYISYI